MVQRFECPQCGAQSKVRRRDWGRRGPCWNCGRAVAIVPPAARQAPPAVRAAAARGALLGACVATIADVGCRVAPTLATLAREQQLTWQSAWETISGWLVATVLCAAAGGVVLALVAARTTNAASYQFISRAALGGSLLIGCVAIATVAHYFWTEVSGLPALLLASHISAGALAGAVAGAACGALLAAPAAAARTEKFRDATVLDFGDEASRNDADSQPVDAELL